MTYAFYPPSSSGGGGIQSINGDSTSAQSIVGGTGISVATSSGTTTITNTSPSSGGTVTSVSVVTANGLSGTVANPTTTPAITLTLGANAVANSQLAEMATNTIKGNNTGVTANAADLTVAQVNAILPVFTSSLNGLAPLSGGGTTNYLRADGSWVAPPGATSGTVTSVGVSGGTTGLTTSGGPITASGTITLAGTLAIASGGTGNTSATAAFNALSPMTTAGDIIIGGVSGAGTRLAIGTSGQILTVSGGAPTWAAAGAGTVTSVNVSGGTTGLTTSGGPITGSGTITLAGTLAVANGGTGSTSGLVTQSGIGMVASAGQLLGTNTNDAASAGNVGQFVTSFVAEGSAVSMSTGVNTNITSISLTAGDWDVSGMLLYVGTASGISGYTICATSTTGGVGTLGQNKNSLAFAGSIASAESGITLPPIRVSLASTTTYYLVGSIGFSGGTATTFGSISARRVR